MHRILFSIALILLSGCQIDPYTFSPHWTSPDWYGAGKEDAMDGVKPQSRDDLASGWKTKEVNYAEYQKGYREGLDKICQSHLLYGWGVSGKRYPERCDGREDSQALREAWQKGEQEGSKQTILN